MKHEKIHEFLKDHPVAVLSTATAEGTPWGAAIYYVADEDFKFYFVTRHDTTKFKNLDENPEAALTIVDADGQVTVQAGGSISRVPPHDYNDVVFTRLAKLRPKGDYNWAPPAEKVHAGDYMVLCLTPNRLQYADYKRPQKDLQTEFIETIIPAEK